MFKVLHKYMFQHCFRRGTDTDHRDIPSVIIALKVSVICDMSLRNVDNSLVIF